jgi:ribosomal protein L31
MKTIILAAALLLLPAAARAQAPAAAPAPSPAADSAAIRRAALDYIEGWFTGDGDRMHRAVHPELAKRAVVRDRQDGSSWLSNSTADAMVHATRAKAGTDVPPDRREARVDILDLFGDIATVRLTSTKLVDYMHLARWNGEWKIVNVLWAPRQ